MMMDLDDRFMVFSDQTGPLNLHNIKAAGAGFMRCNFARICIKKCEFGRIDIKDSSHVQLECDPHDQLFVSNCNRLKVKGVKLEPYDLITPLTARVKQKFTLEEKVSARTNFYIHVVICSGMGMILQSLFNVLTAGNICLDYGGLPNLPPNINTEEEILQWLQKHASAKQSKESFMANGSLTVRSMGQRLN